MNPADLLNVHVGDRILIVDHWISGCCQNSSGRMDKYLGKTLTISEIHEQTQDYFSCRTKEDNGRWYWNYHCIAEVVHEYDILIDLTEFI